jgi:hypothetical protein
MLPSPSSPFSPSLLLFPPYTTISVEAFTIASVKAFIFLELALTLSTSFKVFYLLPCPSTQVSPAIFFLHCVYYKIWLVSWVEMFESRYMILRQFLNDTCLFFGFDVIFRLHRPQSCLLRTPTHRSMACTRQ